MPLLLLLLPQRLLVSVPLTDVTNEIFQVLPSTSTMSEELVVPITVNVAVINIVSVVQNAWAAVVVAVDLACQFLECVGPHIDVPLIVTLFLRLAQALPLGPHGLLCPVIPTRVFITHALHALLRMVAFGLVLRVFMPLPPAPIMAVRILQTNVLVESMFLLLFLPRAIIIRALPVRQRMDVFGRELLVIIPPLLAILLVVQTLLASAQFLVLCTLSPQSTRFTQQFLITLPLQVAVITTLVAIAVLATLPVCGIQTRLPTANLKSSVISLIVH